MNPNEEHHNETPAPNINGEEMIIPENMEVTRLTEQTKSSVITGPILFTLAIILAVILGGLYYWFNIMDKNPSEAPPVERPTADENNEPESTTAEAQADAMTVTSPSDEIGAIESDLEATDLESLDAELDAIDAELDAALQE
ncbi:hypothetical protein KC851_01125 [Candidatus Kaiserbacteria bacterium]|nr:hypothetical protein [Candidatus Kaiserbacteria bacterium]